MEAQVLLKQGAVRRVRNGNSISILRDPWLPSKENLYVQSTLSELEGQTVSSLMVEGRNEWNEEKISNMFNDRDANLIRAVPVKTTEEDSWYWKYEKLGKYTVKSAYNAILGGSNQHDSSNNSGFWRVTWNLKISPKVKIFMWRAIRDILPIKEQLIRRKVNINPYCPVCNAEYETITHCLISCPFASK